MRVMEATWIKESKNVEDQVEDNSGLLAMRMISSAADQ